MICHIYGHNYKALEEEAVNVFSKALICTFIWSDGRLEIGLGNLKRGMVSIPLLTVYFNHLKPLFQIAVLFKSLAVIDVI
ncbi:hypothetical protein SAMN05443252_105139 [Bacillus sp. OV322]|nr:hypothetical protein SAMN05443252_105139 [Bacillus sp. OV322]